jgi:hypothetical protein
MKSRWFAAFAAVVFATTLGLPMGPLILDPAGASPALPCQETSDHLGTLKHGDPRTGLLPSPSLDDYYYLFVTSSPSCLLGPGGTVNLTMVLNVVDLVASVGAAGTPPPNTRTQRWWVLFHVGTGSTGKGISLDNSKYVSQIGGAPTPCQPTTNSATQTCLNVQGTHNLVLRFSGSAKIFQSQPFGVRITNLDTDGAIVTDHSQLTLSP